MNINEVLHDVRQASRRLALLDEEQINKVLLAVADAAVKHSREILEANREDLQRMDPANPKYDRLKLTEERLEGIITDGDLRRMMEKYDDVDRVTAKDVMSKSPKTISEDELAYNAYRMMEQNSITQLVVVDNDRHYKGMVHIHDILREGVV